MHVLIALECAMRARVCVPHVLGCSQATVLPVYIELAYESRVSALLFLRFVRVLPVT